MEHSEFRGLAGLVCPGHNYGPNRGVLSRWEGNDKLASFGGHMVFCAGYAAEQFNRLETVVFDRGHGRLATYLSLHGRTMDYSVANVKEIQEKNGCIFNHCKKTEAPPEKVWPL